MRFKAYARNPVLSVGENGEWDAGALGTMSVVKVADVFHMYYEAWGIRSEATWSHDEYDSLQIGHATSADGLAWVKDPANPVLPKGKEKDAWDRNGTWDPFMLYEDDLFKMWHGGGNKVCDWGYATSTDGIEFTKHTRISNLGNVEDIQVVHDSTDNRYHIYYWDRAYEPMGLFHVISPDETGFDFSTAERLNIEGETYPGMYKFTHVIQEQDIWFMFYGNFVRPHCADGTIRLAISNDGSHWYVANRNLMLGHDGEILKVNDNRWLMYYGPQGYFDRKDCTINVAMYDGNLASLVEL